LFYLYIGQFIESQMRTSLTYSECLAILDKTAVRQKNSPKSEWCR
jgi:hypothetical protein